MERLRRETAQVTNESLLRTLKGIVLPSGVPPMHTRRQSAFTLIEIMVVVVIIGILTAVMVVYLPDTDKTRWELTNTHIKRISAQITQFKLNHHRYPKKLEDLLFRPDYVNERDWPASGYLDDHPLDAWKKEYVYRVPGTDGRPFDLISYGSDGKPDGEGYAEDIWNYPRRR
jgi:general secretion pathway protein G